MMYRCFLFATSLLASTLGYAGDVSYSADIALQYRVYQQDSAFVGQEKSVGALAFTPKAVWTSADNNDIVSIELFGRVDQHDDDRSHFDVRELLWDHADDGWLVRAGIGSVFWGVTESQHLIDVINQTDNLEGIDGEDKLGQPMVHLSLEKDWGITDLFWLPYFRTRQFVGEESRLRFNLPISSKETYESDKEERRQDWALRWSHYIDIYDFAISHFHGTQRSPEMIIDVSSGNPIAIPFYPTINETALMAQATLDSWLWKLESKHLAYTNDTAFLAVGGFEYSIYDIKYTGIDLGLISEYHFDDRGDSGSALENDLMLGARLAFNDVDSTEILAGAIIDLDDDSKWISIEASKRFGNAWKGSIEMRLFSDIPKTDPLNFLDNDDFIEFEMTYYF